MRNEHDVAEYFAEQLRLRSHDPHTETIFIPNLISTDWTSEATRTKYPTNRASAFLNSLAIDTLRKAHHKGQRGWIWIGKASEDREIRKLGEPPPWTSNAQSGKSTPY